MRPSLIALAVLVSLSALPRPAAAQDERPDLTGSWKLHQPDSLLVERSVRPPVGGGMGGPGGRPRGGPRDSVPLGPSPEITIAQSDSTVTIGGGRLPPHTYHTDGREETIELLDTEHVVRAWWDGEDLVIERRGDERTTTESYRLDVVGPRLIVIVEIDPDEGSNHRPLRFLRIYDRAVAPEPSG